MSTVLPEKVFINSCQDSVVIVNNSPMFFGDRISRISDKNNSSPYSDGEKEPILSRHLADNFNDEYGVKNMFSTCPDVLSPYVIDYVEKTKSEHFIIRDLLEYYHPSFFGKINSEKSNPNDDLISGFSQHIENRTINNKFTDYALKNTLSGSFLKLSYFTVLNRFLYEFSNNEELGNISLNDAFGEFESLENNYYNTICDDYKYIVTSAHSDYNNLYFPIHEYTEKLAEIIFSTGFDHTNYENLKSSFFASYTVLRDSAPINNRTFLFYLYSLTMKDLVEALDNIDIWVDSNNEESANIVFKNPIILDEDIDKVLNDIFLGYSSQPIDVADTSLDYIMKTEIDKMLFIGLKTQSLFNIITISKSERS